MTKIEEILEKGTSKKELASSYATKLKREGKRKIEDLESAIEDLEIDIKELEQINLSTDLNGDVQKMSFGDVSKNYSLIFEKRKEIALLTAELKIIKETYAYYFKAKSDSKIEKD